ncbi:MAG TPA: hypothetical protein VFW10_05070 [Steroidobacteraceae bacterium]|nr:hypothetical protein [Steroidobacteraceae bacterium]
MTLTSGDSDNRIREGKRTGMLAIGAAALLALGGCKTMHHLVGSDNCNKPQPYMQATSIPRLNVPSGLDSPDTSHALDVPQLNGPPPPPRGPKDPCLEKPPPFNVAQPNARPEA